MNDYHARLVKLLQKDRLRLRVLECVSELALPDCLLAAGFVRNMVWDYLHKISPPTPLSDVDVIYFDQQQGAATESSLQSILLEQMPDVNWQVKNQARIHERNSDRPYTSTLDAMRHWPEKETAVGMRKAESGKIECISAFGFESLFRGELTHNPKRLRSVFDQRVAEKCWLDTWPDLQVA